MATAYTETSWSTGAGAQFISSHNELKLSTLNS